VNNNNNNRIKKIIFLYYLVNEIKSVKRSHMKKIYTINRNIKKSKNIPMRNIKNI